MKRIIRYVVNSLDYDICRVNSFKADSYHLAILLNHFDIGLVLDIGANTGQFSSSIRKAGYKNNIVSFEPLSSAYKGLLSRAEKDKTVAIVIGSVANWSMTSEITRSVINWSDD